MATNGNWAIADIETIRRAYGRTLKTIKPESDPAGFQALLRAFERIPAQRETTATAPEDVAIRAFVARLTAFRHAGDIDAAIAAIEELFATRLPGDRVLEGIGDALFETAALDPSLSVRLFRHLTGRFDWCNARSRAAKASPLRHSLLLARVAAEDWHQELLARAAKPGDVGAACVVARGGVLPLPPGGLDKAAKKRVKALMGALIGREAFLLERFDARTLAALREAVEGPPLLAPRPEPEAAPAVRQPSTLRARRLAIAAAVTAAVILGLRTLGLI